MFNVTAKIRQTNHRSIQRRHNSKDLNVLRFRKIPQQGNQWNSQKYQSVADGLLLHNRKIVGAS
jgi:hypothetical protein